MQILLQLIAIAHERQVTQMHDASKCGGKVN
jgi:hypothetical protein